MNYGYARVSSKEQDLSRQLVALKEVGVEINNIYMEKKSGKNFKERTEWATLRAKARRGDVIFIKSLDRLSRNYTEVRKEWSYLTEKKGVNIVILDMPILDTRTGGGLMGKVIGDVVLTLLAFVAQNEREKIRERQEEGIKLAKERGVRFGQPQKPLPEGFEEVAKAWAENNVSVNKGAESLGMARATFWMKAKEYALRNGIGEEVECECGEPPDIFWEYIDRFMDSDVTYFHFRQKCKCQSIELDKWISMYQRGELTE